MSAHLKQSQNTPAKASRSPQLIRRRRYLPWTASLLTAAVLGLSACSSDVDNDQPKTKTAQASSELAKKASKEPLKVPKMSAEDGWVTLHELEIPEAGTAVMTIDGSRYDLEIQCSDPGIVNADEDVGLSNVLFSIKINGDFKHADGRPGYINLARWVSKEPESFYPYPGQDGAFLQVVINAKEEGLAWSSFAGGPNDSDPRGESLPLLHAQPDGSFTVDLEIKKMMFHKGALEGPLTLAGRCPEPWGKPDQ
ncbi:hypothetical protein H2508_12220 [Parahaliea sp. F7430]|uniref:Uncharacterized protein n=1 Tax=Sediminihaliea albiluteola TaxID=2758564 RepID=A0A7W2TXQ6_9GAMM|nr:hypothetical protein [Sediminihaliea albiluteola]MBA6413878.1 hypothetical protein [Sediminihaliea albiluteola]